jgi:glucose-1-phosphate thymidylyltransferase
MKGIILAGGTGIRLYPLTKVTNKHLLPVGKEPMIFNPIRQLICSEIRQILVVTSREQMGAVVQLLGSGREFGCSFTFIVQDSAGGIADALSLAENFIGNDRMVVILGDNILTVSIEKHVNKFKDQSFGARVLLKEVNDPERYGVATLDKENDIILCIEEKPEKPNSCYAVMGVYMYGPEVFDIIRSISPSNRGELEITSVNNVFIEKCLLQYDIYPGKWTDAGTFESLHYANKIMLECQNKIFEGGSNDYFSSFSN